MGQSLRVGMHGSQVLALQRRLNELGYTIAAPDGSFGQATLHEVVAFQKVNGLSRDGVVGPATRTALAHPDAPAPRSKAHGFHIEIDLSHQVLLLVQDGHVLSIFDTSTGSGHGYYQDGQAHVAVTPTGTYRITRKIDAWHRSPLGLLYRPAYFNGGIAIHGAPEVPAYPASHGCVRVTTWVMDMIYDRLTLGTTVIVY